MKKAYLQAALQVIIILSIGIAFVWITAHFTNQKPQEEIVKNAVKEIILKKPACPNTSDYFEELKNSGQIVILAKDFSSYGVNGRFTNIKTTIVKSSGSGSQIACGYLFIKASVSGRPLQQEWEHPYVRPGEFGGHLILDQIAVNKDESDGTELIFNLSNINYKEKLSSEVRWADWAALLNVSDKTTFNIALSTLDKGGVLEEVSIVYQCWNPETGQITHDCHLSAQ